MDIDQAAVLFERYVRNYFGFLTSEYGMEFGRGKVMDRHDPRDMYIRVRCESQQMRLDFAWNLLGQLQIMIRNRQIPRGKPHALYFETFVEFLTNGREKPIVPLVPSPKKAVSREQVEDVLRKLAEKLKTYLPDVLACEPEGYAAYDRYLKKRM